MGRGGEEYLGISGIVIDEENEELFVNDSQGSKIMVYDLYGTFKRSFRYVEGIRYSDIYDFDKESLICYETYIDGGVTDNPSFFIISKQDGNIIKNIQIPFEQKKSTIIMQITEQSVHVIPIQHFSIIPYQDNWILTEPSSDTVFIFSYDYTLTPFIARTPSVQSMNPEVFLFPEVLTDRYYFLKIEKKEVDFVAGRRAPKTSLVYDRQNNRIYEYTVLNDDFSPRRPVDMSQRPINNEVAFWLRLEADDLFDAYREGQLKGNLKDIAAGLKEEVNPVIMLVKHKK